MKKDNVKTMKTDGSLLLVIQPDGSYRSQGGSVMLRMTKAGKQIVTAKGKYTLKLNKGYWEGRAASKQLRLYLCTRDRITLSWGSLA